MNIRKIFRFFRYSRMTVLLPQLLQQQFSLSPQLLEEPLRPLKFLCSFRSPFQIYRVFYFGDHVTCFFAYRSYLQIYFSVFHSDLSINSCIYRVYRWIYSASALPCRLTYFYLCLFYLYPLLTCSFA